MFNILVIKKFLINIFRRYSWRVGYFFFIFILCENCFMIKEEVLVVMVVVIIDILFWEVLIFGDM